MFVLIKIIQSYDDIISVESMGLFETEEAADIHSRELNKEHDCKARAHMEYIENYVKNINVPMSCNYDEWQAFVKPYNNIKTTPKDFKSSLLSMLRNGHPISFKDYNPPNYNRYWLQLFIVKI